MNGSPYNFPLSGRASKRDTSEPIAIVGAACRLPGAPDLPSFARLLDERTDAVTEIPDWRWNKARFFHPDRGQRGKAYTFAAGVLDEVDRFDAAFFGISPREAVQVDPQQRLCLELAYEALENAGIDAGRLAGESVGVFVGGSSWDYLNRHLSDPATTDAYSMTGVTLCSLANRVSYAFDLRGPSFTVDTACSSSLVALHQACEALRSERLPMALVGGVSLLLAPQSFVGFSAASMLSPRGRCHAFDARADGYVRAEGGGFVVLKPLGDAIAAGDPIRAVIRGTGVNSDGRTTGFSLPNREAQAALLGEVYQRFGLDPDDLAYVEAHGTGTPAGDPIEAGALGEMLGRRRKAPLPIGSVKTNIGHLEAGSGMAGLLKAMLVAERGIIPASLHCAIPNPNIAFEELNLRLAPEPILLPEATRAGRLIGINSFGFGGTNAHAVLETAPIAAEVLLEDEAGLPPLLLSAQSEEALQALAREWRARAATMAPASLAAAIRGAAHHRTQHKRRAAIAASDASALVVALNALAAGKTSPSLATDTAVSGRIAFVFSGNGSQWAGMARDAILLSADFRAALDEVEQALHPWLGWSVTDALASPDEEALRDTATAQPLLFAIQVALVTALRGAGVQADAFMGHSVGEVAAAWAAGVLDLDAAARVIAVRSGAQQQRHGIGGMGVLGLSAPAVHAALADPALADLGIEVAASNSAQATTVAGSDEALEALGHEAKARGWRFTRLDLEYAFHSAAMDPIEGLLQRELSDLEPHAGSGFVSTVTGTRLDGHALDAGYWWRNVRAPVLFAEAARTLVDEGYRIFVEIGPHPVLRAYLGDALRAADREGRVLASLNRRPVEHDPIAAIAMRCHAAGADIREGAAFAGPTALDALPLYPWQRERFWLERTDEAADPFDLPLEHPLLGVRSSAEPLDWSCHVALELQPWVADHVVGGAAVMPAAALVDMALAAARARAPADAPLELLDVEIGRAMVLEPGMIREMRLRIGSPAGDFEVASRPRLAGDPWTVHMRGRIVDAGAAVPLVDVAIAAAPRTAHLDKDALYALASGLGLDYGPAFRAIGGVDVRGEDAAVALLTATGLHEAGFLLSPDLVDGALQGLLALAAGKLGKGAGVVPWRFGRVRLLRRDGAPPTSARMRLTRVGPRSVRADIALVAADGSVVAEMIECWFVRVALGGGRAGDDAFYHIASVPSVPLGAAAPAVAGVVRAAANDTIGELQLLAEAFAASAASEALRPFATDGVIDRDALVRAGAAANAPLLDRLLGWLDHDGLAEPVTPTRWRLIDDDLPSADTILRTILADAPGAIAEIASLALAADTLPAAILSDGTMPPPSAALLEQMLTASPAGIAAATILGDAVREIASAWPQGRVMRILQIGAARGSFTGKLLDAIGDRPFELVATTSADDLPLLTEELAAVPASRAVLANAALGSSSFDLVIGYQPIAGGSIALADIAMLVPALAPGATLLLTDVAPNRVWQLVAPPGTLLADEPAWRASLTASGFGAIESRTIDGGLWPSLLLSARIERAGVAAPAEAGAWVIVAEVADPLAPVLATALQSEGASATIVDAAGWPDAITPLPARAVLLLGDDAARLAATLARIAALASAASADTACEIALVVRGRRSGDPIAAALDGAARVLANEAATIARRSIRLDPALPLEQAATLLARELSGTDAEQEISWDADGRHVPRVRRGLPAVARAEAPLRLSIDRPGLLDSLGWSGVDAGTPGAGEVAIKVEAAALNFRDVMWAMGLLPDEALLDGFAGATLGLECAGTITAVGAGVDRFAPGDRVMAFAPASLATETVTAAHAVMRMPPALDFRGAATVPVAFLTVVYSIGHLARLQPGETILIHGGAGGVGLAAIQYARYLGARVFATAGSPAKRALLKRLGVGAVLDSRSLDFADEVLRLTDGEGVDVVLNSLAGEAMRRSLGLLKPFGRFLELGKRDFYENSAIGLRPFRHNVTYFGIDADQLPVKQPTLAAKLFDEISDLFAQGALRPLPHRAFDFAEVESAFRLMQSSGHIGKIVLEPGAVLPAASRQAPTFTADAGGVYLITGGLDGFGYETAQWLARHGARKLALLGRRGQATPGAADRIAALVAEGIDARAYACDVADERALGATLATIRADQGGIVGVVHAAVAMDDGLLAQLDEARFARALAPKLAGADALDRLTRDDPIGLFLLFSSVTTPMGNPGQANYVAGNAAIEAVAERRHAAGLPALAVQWGPIGDAGYLARTQEVSDLLARQLGGQHMTAAQTLDALPALLAVGRPVLGMAAVNWGALKRRLPLLASPLFSEIGGSAGEERNDVDLRTLLSDCTPEEAQARATAMLIEEVARIMKLAPDRIEPQRPLTEFGMDSLMAVELRLAVEQRFGISVPLLALSEGATLSAMAARILRGLGGDARETVPEAAQLAHRIRQFEGATFDGPADRAIQPSEPAYAAAAANAP